MLNVMDKMPKVSVVIPCYNQGKYLEEAVESVLNQTFQDFEIIIVDDGSTDDSTKNVLKNYQKPKTKVIHTDNKGLASARNRGIQEAKGEYILPLDADDKIGREYLEEAVKILDKNRDIGIVYCEAVYFGAQDGLLILPEYSLEKILTKNIIFCSALFRKQHWEIVGGYNINMVYGLEDWDFWLSLIELGLKIYRIPKVLFHYRITELSMRNQITEDEQFFMILHASINHRQLYKNVAEIRIVPKIAQVYIDTGFGFNEKQLVSQIILGDEKRLEFDLNGIKDIKAVRFDPINEYCVLHINSIVVIANNKTSYAVKKWETNCCYEEENNFIFTSNDPQLIFNVHEGLVHKIIINLEYIAVGKDAFPYILKYTDKLLTQKYTKEIEAKERYINEIRNHIDVLKLQVEAEKTSREILLKSRSWKLMTHIRRIFVHVRKLTIKIKTIACSFSRQHRLIKKSGLFDATYYLEKNQDVNKSNINPLAHYILFGANEGREPNPLFNSQYYLDENPDVAESGINPLAHYLKVGFKEGRDPNPLFETSYYLKENPDVTESGMNPLVHYLEIGAREGRDPNQIIEGFTYKPTISIITSVFNINERCLHNRIRSVLNQIYNKCELCLVDDGSTKTHIESILEEYKTKDKRVKAIFLKENQGMAKAFNEGLSLVTGDFVLFLSNYELTIDALYECAYFLNKNPEADLIYSDDDTFDSRGNRIEDFFRLDLLLSMNYFIGHFTLFRKSIISDIGGFGREHDGPQDQDFLLSFIKKTSPERILHIPKRLYS